jgi:hypothetical protein
MVHMNLLMRNLTNQNTSNHVMSAVMLTIILISAANSLAWSNDWKVFQEINSPYFWS